MPDDDSPPADGSRPRVHPAVDRLAAYSWRLLVIVAVLVGILWLVGQMWLVFLPLVVTAFLARALSGPAAALRARGVRPGLAALAVVLGFLVVLAGVGTLIGVAVAGEVDQIAPTVSDAIDEFEEWLVEDSPFDVDRSDIMRFRQEAGDSIRNSLRSSSGELVSGAVIVVEIVIGLFLALIITFFTLKDGDRFLRWARNEVPAHRRELADRMARKAWATLGGYLRGAALLGLLEGIVIGLAVFLVGGDLAVPVAVVTFFAAFVPFVGAIVAGTLATLVTLATAGFSAAFIVLVVAVIVQQFDNDLLAPVVYGRALELHPVLVLLAITGGGALFGLPGSFLAVPVVAVLKNVAAEARASMREDREAQAAGATGGA